MFGKPGQSFRGHSLSHDLGHDFFKLTFECTNPTVGQHDVRVQDFTGQRIYSAGADRGADIVVQPTNKIVLNVFRIEVHILIGLFILLSNNDRFVDSDLLERFVPVQHTIAYPSPVTNGSRVFEVEHDLFFGWAKTQFGIAFFDVPPVDVANGCPVAIVFSIVIVIGGEIPDSLVCHSRLVALGAFAFADRVM